MDEWRYYMKEKINHVIAPVPNQSWMILKPPQHLLEVKPEAYNPKLVTIGPLYQNLEPSPINNYKALCVKEFMERHEISTVEDLIQDIISHQQHELSHIYNLNLLQSEIEWLQLLVTVDTVFIYEFLLGIWLSRPMQSVGYFATFYNNDHTLRMRLQRDLLLIGNQIPMSFLKKLVNNRDFSLADLEKTVRAFIVQLNPFFSSEASSNRFLEFLESKNIQMVEFCDHLLHCLYLSCTVKEKEEEESVRQTNSEESTRISVSSCFSPLSKLCARQKTKKLEAQREEYVSLPTASQLYKARIRFKACEGNISVMKYDQANHRLHLPRLVVFDDTEILMRNLIAHEITSRKRDEFSMYANIMDMLIDTPKDIAILKKAKVIENHLGNDERFVNMWNNMCINVPYHDKSPRWEQMIHDIVAHHSSRRRRWYAEFRKKFCSRPWLLASFLAAFLLLSATIYQATYSGVDYYKPKH